MQRLAALLELYHKVLTCSLRVAAYHYTQIAEGCMEGLKCPWDLTLGQNRFDDWTSELRQKQIARLEASRERDRAAIAAISNALESLK